MFLRQAIAAFVGRFGRFLEISVTLSILILIPVSAAAQGGGVDYSGTGGVDSISGRIYFPSGRQADLQLKVSMESSNAGTRVLFVDRNGYFSFRNLEPGRYTVTVDGGKEYEN